MSYYYFYKYFVKPIKYILGLEYLSDTIRKKRTKVGKLFYHHKYTAIELVEELKKLGLTRGAVVIVHSAFSSFYNYQGTPEELIDEILKAIGPDGTLCMPAYPNDKFNPNKIFDVRTDKSAAGLLTEVFRNRPGVKRSLNKLHSVCALGAKADYIVCEHHLSKTSFDEHSPFYKIYELGGISIALGLHNYFMGTCVHVPESLLREKFSFFRNKFAQYATFKYIDKDGKPFIHTTYTKANDHYVRYRNTKLMEKYFDSSKYKRVRFSNLRITIWDTRHVINTLIDLASQGITIYSHPKFSK